MESLGYYRAAPAGAIGPFFRAIRRDYDTPGHYRAAPVGAIGQLRWHFDGTTALDLLSCHYSVDLLHSFCVSHKHYLDSSGRPGRMSVVEYVPTQPLGVRRPARNDLPVAQFASHQTQSTFALARAGFVANSTTKIRGRRLSESC